MEIEGKIAQIRDGMDRNIPQAEIDSQLEELKQTVKSYTQKANQRYSIKQVEAAINRIKKINSTINKGMNGREIESNRKALETDEEYIASLSNRISDFQGQERDGLIATLMEARYRIAIGKLLVLEANNLTIYSNMDRSQICDFFKNVSEVEKIMYGKFLMDDMDELITRYNIHYQSVEELVEMAKQIQDKQPDLEKIIEIYGTDEANRIFGEYPKMEELTSQTLLTTVDAKTSELQDKFFNDLMNDFQITGLFSNRDFILQFIETTAILNSVAKQLEKDRQYIELQVEQAKRLQEEINRQEKAHEEEQARIKALEEKYKNMTEQEIQAEIEKIDRETFDLKQKYKRIIEFQIAIAKARGIIGEKETMHGDDVAYLSCRTSELPTMIKKLNASTIFNNAMIGVDDDRATSLIMVTKVDEEKAKEIHEKEDKYPNGYWKKGEHSSTCGAYIGKLSGEILDMMLFNGHYFLIEREQRNQYLVYGNSFFDTNEKKLEMKRLYQTLIASNLSESTMQNIKFSIQLPLQRSLLPVIEQLKQAGIEFYIPPVDIPEFEFKKVAPTYRIYIDRQYLEQYKEQVHPELSQKGVVMIGDENPKLSEMLLQDCEFPYGLDKQKEH